MRTILFMLWDNLINTDMKDYFIYSSIWSTQSVGIWNYTWDCMV